MATKLPWPILIIIIITWVASCIYIYIYNIFRWTFTLSISLFYFTNTCQRFEWVLPFLHYQNQMPKKKKLENQDKRKERSYVAKRMHKGKWAPWGNIPPFKTWYIDPNVWHLELNMFPNFSIITNKAIILRCLCHNNNCYLLVWHYLSKKKKKSIWLAEVTIFFFIYKIKKFTVHIIFCIV